MSDIIRIHPVGAKLFHVGGQLDERDEASSHFSKFCERA